MGAHGNVRGILLMTAGMLAATTGDVFVKILAASMDATQVSVVTGLGMVAIFGAVASSTGRPIAAPDLLHPAVFIRTAAEVGGVFLLVVSLSLTSLTILTALMQTVPLLVTLGAVLVLGERAERADWIALLIGFSAMLLIVRPGLDDTGLGALVAALAAVTLSVRDLASRACPPEVSTPQLGFWAGLALGIFGIGASLAYGVPTPAVTAGTAAAALGLVLAAGATFFCITAAMRTGDVAVVSPFRYTRLAFGVGYGVIVFGEQVDTATAAGATIIVASGLYLWRRQRRRVVPRM